MRAILSASNLAAAALCSGKPKMEAGLADSDSAYSIRGTNLHPYFRTALPRENLPAADQALLAESDVLSERFIAQFRDLAGLTSGDIASEEHEITLTGTISGHADDALHWRGGEFVAILDLKSGVQGAEEAPSNLQLRSYSLGMWERKPFKLCGVAIVQPDAMGPRMTTAFYTADMMPLVRDEITAIIQRTQVENPPLVPGDEQCQFCKAKATCPAFNGPFRQLQRYEQFAISSLTNEDLEFLHTVGQRWNQIKSQVSAELRSRIESGALTGWKLQNTGSTKTIADCAAYYRRLLEFFPDAEDLAGRFMRCLKPTWAELTSLGIELTNLPEKKARAKMEEIGQGLISEEPKAPTPKRI
jgi:hypothetical protein